MHFIGAFCFFAAWVDYGSEPNSVVSFEMIFGIVILLIGWILGIGVLVLWVMGLIGAAQGEEKRVPLLGDQFQEWFRNIA